MKTLTIRLPDPLVSDIEAEARSRNISKSDVVRERLQSAAPKSPSSTFDQLADIIGSVKGLPADLSSRKKAYLAIGYGRKSHR